MKTSYWLNRNRLLSGLRFLTALLLVPSVLLISASSSPGKPPQNYTGTMTHGEFISCTTGQPLDPPAYSVDGTWVLHIDSLAQAQVPPPAQLTLVVFRDGKHYLQFPNIELTPVSFLGGVYTYSFGPQVTVTLDTNTNPATFYWHVEGLVCSSNHPYDSLTYFGVAY